MWKDIAIVIIASMLAIACLSVFSPIDYVCVMGMIYVILVSILLVEGRGMRFLGRAHRSMLRLLSRMLRS